MILSGRRPNTCAADQRQGCRPFGFCSWSAGALACQLLAASCSSPTPLSVVLLQLCIIGEDFFAVNEKANTILEMSGSHSVITLRKPSPEEANEPSPGAEALGSGVAPCQAP